MPLRPALVAMVADLPPIVVTTVQIDRSIRFDGLRLENKVALITGGASGIGRATAIRFAEEGAHIAVADRAIGGAEEVAAQVRKLGRKSVAIQVDTSDEGQVDAMITRTVAALGGLDIVLAAAGISHARYGEEGRPPVQMTIDKPLADWRRVHKRQPRWGVSYLPRRGRNHDRAGEGRPHHYDRVGGGEVSAAGCGRILREQGRSVDAEQGDGG